MGISRAAQSSTSIHRNLNVTRLRRRDVSQIRNLWWWGKQHKGGLWAQHQHHEDIEERLRRHQSIMMHRYSKALKRRALWDREHGIGVSSWRYRACRMDREMSSSDPGRPAGQETDRSKSRDSGVWHELHNDFESFKAAVDRAIERDPCGTLFGRRLKSPESTTNSWTSWSWIFDPKEIKEDPVVEPEKKKQESRSATQTKVNVPQNSTIMPSSTLSKPQSTISHSNSSSKTNTTLGSSQSIIYAAPPSNHPTSEYVYDPITGRRVLQSSPSQPTPKQEPSDVPTKKTTEPVVSSPPTGGILRSLFATEHGVDIPVKTYKPTKVFGYTGEAEMKPKLENKTTEPNTTTKKRFESSRKREYNQLRAITLGNSIDTAAMFGGRFDAETTKATNLDANEPEEKRIRASPAPGEDTPLFSGTAYETRSEACTQPLSNWLSREGFRTRPAIDMPSLRTGGTSQVNPSGTTERLQTALDRKNTTAADIPVRKFVPKLQASIDRVVPSMKEVDSSPSKAVPMQVPKLKSVEEIKHESREDVDLLRASDVRAAAKAARVTKQAIEDKKRKDRADLERDFEQRQTEEQSPVGVGAKILSSAPSTIPSLNTIWKHVKEYPSGIVAKTMQHIGLAQNSQNESQGSVAVSKGTAGENREDGQLRSLASDLKHIVDEHRSKVEPAVEQHRSPKVAPVFSEPTVKPGVVRNLEIERHTKEFEPKLASIVDRAKAVKRELHDVSLSIGDVVNERAITAVAARHVEKKKQEPITIGAASEVSPATPKQSVSQSLARDTVTTSAAASYDSPFILLVYNKAIDDVEVTSLNNLMGGMDASGAKLNPMAAIGSLNRPNVFVKHFVDLDNNGYELKSGGGDVLIFQKRKIQPVAADSSVTSTYSLSPSSGLRNKVAAAEAAAQPPSTPNTIVSGSLKAANVLSEIPASIPKPGPTAPTAPPTKSNNIDKLHIFPTIIPLASISQSPAHPQPQPTQTSPPQATSPSQPSPPIQPLPTPRVRKPRSQVRRQEEVFSGQQRLPRQTTSLPDATHFQKQTPAATSYGSQSSTSEPQPSFFARLRRTVRYFALTVLALSTGAYGIGVIAEGIASKAQIEGRAGGPMKRLVLEGEEGRRMSERQRVGWDG